MKKKTPDETTLNPLFQKAVHGTQPLTHRDEKQIFKKPPSSAAKQRRHAAITEKKPPEELPPIALDVSAQEMVLFAPVGMQAKQLKQLKQGLLPRQALLDLHGFTLVQAHDQLQHFIEKCYHQGLRSVMVIHGKGARTKDDKPLMKNLVINLLKEHPLVTAFSSAPQHAGGAGALCILLRNNPLRETQLNDK